MNQAVRYELRKHHAVAYRHCSDPGDASVAVSGDARFQYAMGVKTNFFQAILLLPYVLKSATLEGWQSE